MLVKYLKMSIWFWANERKDGHGKKIAEKNNLNCKLKSDHSEIVIL